MRVLVGDNKKLAINPITLRVEFDIDYLEAAAAATKYGHYDGVQLTGNISVMQQVITH